MKTGIRVAFFLAAATFLTAAVYANCNLTLTVTPDTTVVAGNTVTVDVSGAAPTAFVFLASGTELGSTTLNLLGTTLDLGLNLPFGLLPLGFGNATVSATLPQVPDGLVGTTLHTQAFSLEATFGSSGFSLDGCVSNLDQLAF